MGHITMRRKVSSREKQPPKTASRAVLSNRVHRPAQAKSKRPPYIVGMGGSAGALEAFEQFFRHMPANSGSAFVVVTHMDPSHKGMMPELLGRYTTMPV